MNRSVRGALAIAATSGLVPQNAVSASSTPITLVFRPLLLFLSSPDAMARQQRQRHHQVLRWRSAHPKLCVGATYVTEFRSLLTRSAAAGA